MNAEESFYKGENKMNKRPVLILIIAIILIIVSCFSALSDTLMLLKNLELKPLIFPFPTYIKIILMYMGSTIIFISGILMIKGNALGRNLIVVWCLCSLAIYNDYIVPRIVYLALLCLALFNKTASTYFNKGKSVNSMNNIG